MYKLLKQENRARRGEFHTVHGTIQTPAFMNVATAAAIKGGLSAYDLREIKCQVMLSNTYHLHLRPGDENVRKLGGIHKFTGWQGPVLTVPSSTPQTRACTVSSAGRLFQAGSAASCCSSWSSSKVRAMQLTPSPKKPPWLS